MSIGEYLKEKIIHIFISILTCIISLFFMILAGVSINYSIFIVLIIFSGLAINTLLDFFMKAKYYRELRETIDEIEEKSYITEMLQRPNFIEGKIIYDVLKSESKYINDKIAEYDIKYKEYEEYMETWIHEVKTPIATSKLLIENNKNITTLSIGEEIDKIDNYVEQVLYFAKSGSVEKDYKVKRILLKSIVMTGIKKNSKAIINARIKPSIRELDYYILADSKWIEFIIGQIITNSIKYKSDNAIIDIYAEKQNNKVILHIKDNGMGISKEDIGRVFEKGFTGINGRQVSKSTGMGLYICKSLCNKMGIDININSNLGKGTTVSLIFKEAV